MRSVPKLRSVVAGVLLCILCTAAVGADVENSARLGTVKAAVQERSLDPQETVFPDLLTEEMKAWAHATVPAKLSPAHRAARLQQALMQPWGLNLRYREGYTGTAEEVFASGEFNCVSFAHLFSGLARELGIAAYYVKVHMGSRRERRDTFRIVSEHIAVGTGDDRHRRVFDSEGAIPRYRVVERLSDLEALAMFYSNRGAELLLDGQEKKAVDWLEKAVTIDPDSAVNWVNLGVALRRTQDPTGARQAYRKALAIDPDNAPAQENLELLLWLGDEAP